MPPKSTPEKALKATQNVIRQRRSPDDAVVLTLEDSRLEPISRRLELTRGQLEVMEATEAALEADVRFEYLAPATEQVREFAADCAAYRRNDHVPSFVERYGRKPSDRTCYFAVEHVRASEPVQTCGVRFLPADDPEIPHGNPLFLREQGIACVVAVPVTGTGEVQMAARARRAAQHALRLLRVALRESPGLHNRQLRFRLGTTYAFDEHAGGWQAPDDIAYAVELANDMAPFLRLPVASLPLDASKKSVDEKALLAAEWMERAYLATDPLVAMLFRFFALEALLGDVSEDLKAGPLALRQMTLGHVATGRFRNPDATLLNYGSVRSGAVHGEVVTGVTTSDVDQFEWTVRDTLNQYIRVARERGITKRSQLMKILDEHPDRLMLISWLRQNGSPKWTVYLDQIEGQPQRESDG